MEPTNNHGCAHRGLTKIEAGVRVTMRFFLKILDPVFNYRVYIEVMKANETSSSWTRSAVASRMGIGPETLRFYEQKGLLSKPRRSAAGYRLYGAADMERLAFIRRAQDLGFSLLDIKQLLALTGSIKTPRKKMRDFAEARLAVIRQKIRDLKAMEKALSGLVTRCDGRGELKGCPIAEFVGGKSKNSNGEKCHE